MASSAHTTKVRAKRIALSYFKRAASLPALEARSCRSPPRCWRALWLVVGASAATSGSTTAARCPPPTRCSRASAASVTGRGRPPRPAGRSRRPRLGRPAKAAPGLLPAVTDAACQACHAGPRPRQRRGLHPACATCHVEHVGRTAWRRSPTATARSATPISRPRTASAIGVPHEDPAPRPGHPQFAVTRARRAGASSSACGWTRSAGSGDPTQIKLNHAKHLKVNLKGIEDLQKKPGVAGITKVKDGAQLGCAFCHHAGRARPVHAAGVLRQALRGLPPARLRRPLPRHRGAARPRPRSCTRSCAARWRGLRAVPGDPAPARRASRVRDALRGAGARQGAGGAGGRGRSVLAGCGAAAPRPSEAPPADEPRGGRLRGRGGPSPAGPGGPGHAARRRLRGAGRRKRPRRPTRRAAVRGRGAEAAAPAARRRAGPRRRSRAPSPACSSSGASTATPSARRPSSCRRSCRRRSPSRWLPHARFDHGVHRPVACAECHEAATSTETKDVLLPKIEHVPRVSPAQGRRPTRLRGVPPLPRQAQERDPNGPFKVQGESRDKRWRPGPRIRLR